MAFPCWNVLMRPICWQSGVGCGCKGMNRPVPGKCSGIVRCCHSLGESRHCYFSAWILSAANDAYGLGGEPWLNQTVAFWLLVALQKIYLNFSLARPSSLRLPWAVQLAQRAEPSWPGCDLGIHFHLVGLGFPVCKMEVMPGLQGCWEDSVRGVTTREHLEACC